MKRALVLLLLLTACSGGGHKATSGQGSRPVTDAEADRLAVMRFDDYRGTGAHVHTVVSTQGQSVTIDGDVDWKQGLGQVVVSGAGQSATLQFTATELKAFPGTTAKGTSQARPLAPTTSSIDAVLAVVLGLGQDRPDNAQLIQRNGARWLRSDTIGTTKVDVIQGPRATGASPGAAAAVTYWVTADAHLLRVEAHLGGAATATTIDLDPATFKAVTPATG